MQHPIFRILKNTGSLTLANVFGRLLNFVVVAILIRSVGTEGFGGYATAVAVSGYFLILADIGLAGRLVRQAAAFPDSESDEYSHSMGIKLVTTALCVVVLVILAYVLPYERWVKELFILLTVSNLIRSYSQLNHAIFRARERMELEALSTCVQAVIYSSAVALLLLGFPIIIVGWASVASVSAQLILNFVIVRRFIPIRITLPPHWATLRNTAPYTAAAVAESAFLQSDIVVLSFIASQSLIGEFASVSRLLAVVAVFPLFLNHSIMPIWSRVFGRDDPLLFRKITTTSLQMLTIIAGASVVGLAALSKLVLHLVYGEGFEELSTLLVVGAVYLLFHFMNFGISVPIVSSGRQVIRAQSMTIGVFVKIGLILAITPSFGAIGAMIALVIAEATVMLLQAYRIREVIEMGLLAKTWAWVVGGIGISLLLYSELLSQGSEWLAATLPILLYATLIFVSKDVPKLIAVIKESR